MSIVWSSALLMTGAVALLAGCSKDQVEPQVAAQVEEVDPKVPPFFLSYGQTAGTYSVYRWYSNCVESWGTIAPNAFSYANNNTILSNYIRASSGSCAIDANYCRLLRGSTVGSWGPWYYIWPNWGPSITVRKGIKIRVKNLASPPANAYNQGIYYDAPTNTWTVASAIASGNFDIQVTTPGGLTLCPPRE
ncbi:MAG: hypothetical protein IPJ87_03040 [Flavobacteriales bacterium]|jgi:hypothetical protein|nr:hypothetical protein [Flavobacteriales bacterium]MBK7940842.1 hypothetical protein [Flavobacteriales bacterium]MBK8948514.1 hypothetical protein [Flavobacteriales bacterium]MBK9700739.1 hypothetical protein [Flavobacteriales bacterium]